MQQEHWLVVLEWIQLAITLAFLVAMGCISGVWTWSHLPARGLTKRCGTPHGDAGATITPEGQGWSGPGASPRSDPAPRFRRHRGSRP